MGVLTGRAVPETYVLPQLVLRVLGVSRRRAPATPPYPISLKRLLHPRGTSCPPSFPGLHSLWIPPVPYGYGKGH